ncbi:MAG: SRPBCC family protein [Acidimicrobiia bacterium]
MKLVRALGIVAGAAAAYTLVVRGALTLDLGIGRRVRPLGPIRMPIDAPPDVVFDVIAAPYLGRTPRAMEAKVEVLERGSDMVLAAHYTPTGMLTATTVRFERPLRVHFRLLRGPVPHVVETFELRANAEGGTDFEYTGELGTDFGAVGSWWGGIVADKWERTVQESLDGIRAEAERRGSRRPGAGLP